MKKVSIPDFAKLVRETLNLQTFENKSYNTARDAFANLSGKTHYVDPDTLRYFHSRIVYAQPMQCGLIYTIIESAAKDADNTSRGFRAVSFDLFGTVIYRAALENMTSSKATAEKQFFAWFETFDVVNHYKKEFKRKAEQSKQLSRDYSMLARGFKGE